jgi:threonine synthase
VDSAAIDAFYAEMDAQGRRATTLATAIQINRPLSLGKCLRALEVCDGVVREASDAEILDGKAQAGAGGFGCEPASGASIAGAKRLREEGLIAPGDRVVCILTGHELKDPNVTVSYHSAQQSRDDKSPNGGPSQQPAYANRPIVVPNDPERIVEVLREFA